MVTSVKNFIRRFDFEDFSAHAVVESFRFCLEQEKIGKNRNDENTKFGDAKRRIENINYVAKLKTEVSKKIKFSDGSFPPRPLHCASFALNSLNLFAFCKLS